MEYLSQRGTLVRHRLVEEVAAGVPPSQRILAIGAHPDDLELACGGTLTKAVRAGHEVLAVIMSDGRIGGDPTRRAAEAKAGAAAMGVKEVVHFEFPDTQLASTSLDMTSALEEVIEAFQPHVVLTHSAHDLHQDHAAVHVSVLRAARRHSSVLCFESPSATREFDPAVFVDIAGDVEAKVAAVKAHQGQATKSYMDADHIRALATFRGTQARAAFAEAYEPVRLLTSSLGVL